MNERRTRLIAKVYSFIDTKGIGSITGADIAQLYCTDQNPEFTSGDKTKEDLVKEFLRNFPFELLRSSIALSD